MEHVLSRGLYSVGTTPQIGLVTSKDTISRHNGMQLTHPHANHQPDLHRCL